MVAGHGYREDAHDESGPDEDHEVLVVALAHAGSDPGTVVVQSFDARATGSAVDGSRGPVDLAARTPFDLDHSPIHYVEVLVAAYVKNVVDFPAVDDLEEVTSWDSGRIFESRHKEYDGDEDLNERTKDCESVSSRVLVGNVLHQLAVCRSTYIDCVA